MFTAVSWYHIDVWPDLVKKRCFYSCFSFNGEATLTDLHACSFGQDWVAHSCLINDCQGVEDLSEFFPSIFFSESYEGEHPIKWRFCSKEIGRWGNQLRLPGSWIPGTFLILCFINFKLFFFSLQRRKMVFLFHTE